MLSYICKAHFSNSWYSSTNRWSCKIHIISNPNGFPRSLVPFEQDFTSSRWSKVMIRWRRVWLISTSKSSSETMLQQNLCFSTTSNVEVENHRYLWKFFVIWTINFEFICDVMKDWSKSVIEWWMVVQFRRGTHPSKTFRLYLHLSSVWTFSPAGNSVALWMLPIVPIRDHHIGSRKFPMSK